MLTWNAGIDTSGRMKEGGLAIGSTVIEVIDGLCYRVHPGVKSGNDYLIKPSRVRAPDMDAIQQMVLKEKQEERK